MATINNKTIWFAAAGWPYFWQYWRHSLPVGGPSFMTFRKFVGPEFLYQEARYDHQ